MLHAQQLTDHQKVCMCIVYVETLYNRYLLSITENEGLNYSPAVSHTFSVEKCICIVCCMCSLNHLLR